MLKSMKKRIVLYGYGYSGRFLRWYANYYHGIEVDYIVSEDMTTGLPYDLEIFRPTLFKFNYKDVNNAIVWLSEPLTEERKKLLAENGYVLDETVLPFYDMIYKMEGYSIQFLSFLEYSTGSDFVSAMSRINFQVAGQHGHDYSVTTQKELFPVLQKCLCMPGDQDAIFDFGCGKGGAIISFLDYGFKRAGGVEYEPVLYDILVNNMRKLNIDDNTVSCIYGDAGTIDTPLDEYNWFYFFSPFDKEVMDRCVSNIKKSYLRCPRKISVLYLTPEYDASFTAAGFILFSQFTAETRSKGVNYYVLK